MPTYCCPECSNTGGPGMSHEPSAFKIRGQLQGKPVFKCGQCGAGLLRRGIFSNKLTRIPDTTWQEMERQWDARVST